MTFTFQALCESHNSVPLPLRTNLVGTAKWWISTWCNPYDKVFPDTMDNMINIIRLLFSFVFVFSQYILIHLKNI